MKPGILKRKMNCIEFSQCSPSPEAYYLKSTFKWKGEGHSFGTRANPVPNRSYKRFILHEKKVPGPGTYSSKKISGMPMLSYSFSKVSISLINRVKGRVENTKIVTQNYHLYHILLINTPNFQHIKITKDMDLVMQKGLLMFQRYFLISIIVGIK